MGSWYSSPAHSTPSRPQVEIAKQADLGAVMDDLQVGVQDELRHRLICELRWREGALRPGESCRAQAAHIADPGVVPVIELAQRSFSGA